MLLKRNDTNIDFNQRFKAFLESDPKINFKKIRRKYEME